MPHNRLLQDGHHDTGLIYLRHIPMGNGNPPANAGSCGPLPVKHALEIGWGYVPLVLQFLYHHCDKLILIPHLGSQKKQIHLKQLMTQVVEMKLRLLAEIENLIHLLPDGLNPLVVEPLSHRHYPVVPNLIA